MEKQSDATLDLMSVLENESELFTRQDKDVHYITEQILYNNGYYELCIHKNCECNCKGCTQIK